VGYYEVPSLLCDNNCTLIHIIKTLLEEWFSSTLINFSLSINVLIDICQQSTFILENILIPLLLCNLIVNKRMGVGLIAKQALFGNHNRTYTIYI
jgi:hypothetical protein